MDVILRRSVHVGAIAALSEEQRDVAGELATLRFRQSQIGDQNCGCAQRIARAGRVHVSTVCAGDRGATFSSGRGLHRYLEAARRCRLEGCIGNRHVDECWMLVFFS